MPLESEGAVEGVAKGAEEGDQPTAAESPRKPLTQRFRGFLASLGRTSSPKIQVHILIRGRIGEGWLDIDQKLSAPEHTTLGSLIELAERRGIPMRQAIEDSPHLRDTLMLNGERCPVDDNLDRPLQNGDQIYLLAPVAGG